MEKNSALAQDRELVEAPEKAEFGSPRLSCQWNVQKQGLRMSFLD